MNTDWTCILDEQPYEAIKMLGIARGHSRILDYPILSNAKEIEDYRFITEDIPDKYLDAIVVEGLGAIISKKALKHNKKQIDTVLDYTY